jgi:hypothetical protein
MNIRRGLSAAGLGAIAGALLPAALALGYVVYRWSNPGFVPSNRLHYFLGDLVRYWSVPVCGGAAFLGCAAWATFAPPGSWRFASSLLIIFLISVPSWFLLDWLDDWLNLHWLKNYKGEDSYTVRLAQALVLFGLPAATAQVLVITRLWRTKPIKS